MNKLILTFAVLFLSANTLSFADDIQQVFNLKDGSQIKGVLSGVENGVYTVKTPIIGDVQVAVKDVVSITNGDAPVTAAMPVNNTISALPAAGQSSGSMPNNMDQQIATSQQQLMSNPQSMQLIMQMAQNPEIVQALQEDPNLPQAVANHDYAAVQNSPAVQKLLTNPQMMALLQKLAAQQQQQKASSQ